MPEMTSKTATGREASEADAVPAAQAILIGSRISAVFNLITVLDPRDCREVAVSDRVSLAGSAVA